MQPWRNPLWPHDSNHQASAKPGAVQTAARIRRITHRNPRDGISRPGAMRASNCAVVSDLRRLRGMTRHDKTLQQVVLGRADANIAFADLRALLLALAFAERIRGAILKYKLEL